MYAMHHTAISVSSLDASIAFYKLFGFTVAGEYAPEDGSFKIVNLRLGDILLELFCYADPQTGEPADLYQDLPVVGNKHLGLKVASLAAAKKDVEAHGLAILHEDISTRDNGISYFFVKDPDGILLEIAEDHRGYCA